MTDTTQLLRHAARFAALGHEARLAVLRLLVAAHPKGLVVSEIQEKLDIPASTLSHHLEALRHESLIEVVREGRFLRHRAHEGTLRDLLGFLYAECCCLCPPADLVAIEVPGAKAGRRPRRSSK